MRTLLSITRFSLFVLLLLAAPSVWAGPQAGVAAAVRGSVRLDRTGLVGLDVRSGTPILLGDKITTAQDSGLQILLLDETVFTLGPQSEMTIDEFVYDPAHQNGAIDAQMLKGTFRFISGKVAKQKPDQMKVRTPAGTIGIRGTMVLAKIDPVTQASLIVLGGPGARNNTGDKRGSIWVENAGTRRDVLQAGWGVEIPGPDAPPSEPFRVPDTSLAHFHFEPDAPAPAEEQKAEEPSENSPESKPSGEGNGEGKPTSEQRPKPPGPPPKDGPPPPGELGRAEEGSGQRAACDTELGGMQAHLDGRLGKIEGFAANSAQAILGQAVAITSVNQLVQHSGGFNGHFHYVRNGVHLINGDGTFNLFLELDFSNDVVAMQVQSLQSTLFGVTNLNAGGSVPFSTGKNGFADFHITDTAPSGSPCTPGPCSVHVLPKFHNANGGLAGAANAEVILRDPVKETRGGVQGLPITTVVP